MPRSVLPLGGLFDDAVASVLQRPGRSGLTVSSIVLGIGALVATLGLTATAAAQISESFDALEAIHVTVQATATEGEETTFPVDLESRLTVLNGVAAAGTLWYLDEEEAKVTASPVSGGDSPAQGVSVAVASPGLFDAIEPTMGAGVAFDEFHDGRHERTAMVGIAAARRLGISRVEQLPAVYVGGIPFTVVGIMDDLQWRPELLLSVVIPDQTARQLWEPATGTQIEALVRTQLGAAQLIGGQAPLALRPEAPDSLTVMVPPAPESLRRAVEGEVGALFLVLAGVSLVMGAVGIANTTLVSVLERVPEIGLRRAVGATRTHIAAQFLTESALLGSVGGLLGSCLGIAAVVAVAAVQQWTATIDPMVPLLTPLLGTATGLLAGLYPALRAGAIEPVDALRR